MKTIVILMDSLNKKYLQAYGNNWVKTPNIQRLAEKGMVFDTHYCGSLPCMPARRELFTGRLNFLEAPWGPLEPFDVCLTSELRKQKQVYSHMVTDHYHYWEWNGLGYHTVFDTWEFIRGQEGDHWHPLVKDPEVPNYRGKNRRQDWINRGFMDAERDEEYPTPQTFEQAVDFLDNNHDQDNWHLHVEVFDPHEPFMVPSEYRNLYNDVWHKNYHFDWPSYAPVDSVIEGQEAIEHIKKCYAATLTRADIWLGKLLDKLDEFSLWEDTAVILTTDHGHLLGDHGYWAKNYMFDYQEIVNIPLFVYAPGASNNGKRINALTTTIDLMPTILELHDVKIPQNVQGKSLCHLFSNDEFHHDAVLYGYFGKDVNMTDGQYTYCCQPQENSIVHQHTAMPTKARTEPDKYAKAEMGRFLPQTEMPVYRVESPSRKHHNAPEYNLIHDVLNDPNQENPISDKQLEKQLNDKLVELLKRYDAPECQFARLKLL